jgi:Malonyl-CoA decarboxylase C-terminal domain/Malonyl-CoA decarboxylase N-terminal domain
MLDELRSAARKVGSERSLRGLLIDCKRLLSERGEANSAGIAHDLVARFSALPDEQQGTFFERLSSDFSPDPKAVLKSAQAYAEAPNAQNLAVLTQTTEPPRQELLRRINRSPGGTSSIVAMRRALLARVAKKPELQAVEADFLHLLSSWFNPGFLQLQRVDWNSSAQLLEQIIQHEAVHQIDGWDDLRRRLQPDRRCFAFFHPQLPHEPLIFVEVALLPQTPEQIAPLIDKASNQQLPAGPERCVARQLFDQTCGRGTQARAAAAQDLLHALAAARLRALGAGRVGVRKLAEGTCASIDGSAPSAARSLRRRLRQDHLSRRAAHAERRCERGFASPRRLLPGLPLAHAQRRPGRAFSSRQWRPAGTAERAR